MYDIMNLLDNKVRARTGCQDRMHMAKDGGNGRSKIPPVCSKIPVHTDFVDRCMLGSEDTVTQFSALAI